VSRVALDRLAEILRLLASGSNHGAVWTTRHYEGHSTSLSASSCTFPHPSEDLHCLLMALGRVFRWFSAERLGRSMPVQKKVIHLAETSGDGRQRLHFIDTIVYMYKCISTELRGFSSSTLRALILIQQQ
jgi:hypothetical protein